MPCWYYDKKDLKVTPSIKDGLNIDAERRYRREGARFIMDCGTAMGLGHNTMATGVVYFHRFYMFHSFKEFPRYVTACCCLFLAGKVEETPKKCKDIIRTAKGLLSDEKFCSFGEDPKEEVMTLERILLQTIKFDLQVEHPYGFLVKYAKCLIGDQVKLQKMVQMAWNFVNDSLSTTVCLQWEPEIIAVALIHLASKLSKFSVVDWIGRKQEHLRWWDMFVADVTMEILEDICHQVLDLYQTIKNEDSNSPPHYGSKANRTKNLSASPPSAKNSPDQICNHVTIKPVVDEMMAASNPIPSIVAAAPDQMHYMYPSNYGVMYQPAPHYSGVPIPPGPAAPLPGPLPPPVSSMYGSQYAAPMHYQPQMPGPPPPQPQPSGYHTSSPYFPSVTHSNRPSYYPPPPS